MKDRIMSTIILLKQKFNMLMVQFWIYDYDVKYHKTSLDKTDKSCMREFIYVFDVTA